VEGGGFQPGGTVELGRRICLFVPSFWGESLAIDTGDVPGVWKPAKGLGQTGLNTYLEIFS
jgi:hypothetical protein